jgi:Zn-dependent protease
MLSMEPQPNDYDVHFHCCGFPVRVHPFFWLAGLLLGSSRVWDAQGNVSENAALGLLSWMSIMFFSILVHELGHALVMRYYGQSPHIVLYMLGGLAISHGPSSQLWGRAERLTSNRHILISLAGPGAGFLLALLTLLCVVALGGEVHFAPQAFPFFWYEVLPDGTSLALQEVIGDLLFLNIFWGMVNLLPVFPLDGGQVARELFQQADPWHGFARALWLSIFTAAGVGIASWVYLHSRFMPLMFLSLAASNYFTLQQITRGGPGGGRW